MKIIPENKIQQECINWFKNNYCLKHHSPRLLIYSVPNELPISLPPKEMERAMNLMGKTGLLKGANDVIIQGLNGRVLNAECKTKTGTQSESQKDFEARVKELNGHYFIFRSLEEFQENIYKHLDWLLCKI